MDYFTNISYMQSHIFLMLFLYLFITHRYSRTATRWICFASFCILTLTDCLKLNVFPDSRLCYAAVTVFQILLTQSTGIFISEKRNQKVLFIGLSASNYVIVGSVAAEILYIAAGDRTAALAGSFAVHLAVLIMVNQWIRDIWLRQYETEYTEGWWELCLVPVFFYCSFSALAFFPHTLYEIPENIPAILCFMATMFISYVAVLRYVKSDSKQKDVYWKNVLFEYHIRGLEDQYYLVEQAEKNLKVLRHDMRHYSSMISRLLDQGEYEEIRKIVAHINDVAEEHRMVKYCNNLIVNTIFSNMMERVAALDIEVRLELAVPKEIPVNEYEFTAAIANMFENAILCVKDFPKEKRYIDLQVHCSDEYLMVQIRNAYEGEIVLDPGTGLPKSQKGKGHGLGIQSIQAFSDKIGGSFDCFCQDGMFVLLLFAKF